MKKIAHKLRQNLAIIFTAAVCALVVFFIVKNPWLFQASILSLEEKAFMNEKKWDAAYKTTDGMFEVFLAEKHKLTMTNFQGVIYYNPEKVQLDTTNTTGQWTFKITEMAKDSLLITISEMDNIDTSEDIFAIAFSGDAENILLWESKGKTKKKRSYFSVGNLNEFMKHSE